MIVRWLICAYLIDTTKTGPDECGTNVATVLDCGSYREPGDACWPAADGDEIEDAAELRFEVRHSRWTCRVSA